MAGRAKLTPKKLSVYFYMCTFARDNYGIMPTIRQIVDNTDYRGPSEISLVQDFLSKEGLLGYIKRGSRRVYYIIGSTWTEPAITAWRADYFVTDKGD